MNAGIREGDGQTLRLTRGTAEVIPALYVADVEVAHSISFGSTVNIRGDGWRGVLRRGEHQIASGDARYGSRAKSAARLDAQNLKRRYEAHFRITGRYLEEQRREERQALTAAREASSARRRAFTADRVDMWRTLENLLDADKFADGGAEVRQRAADLVERHRQAVIDIGADPENKRGGTTAIAEAKPVLVGGRRP